MITDAAHDLRTPLTAMRGEAEIALRGARTPEEYRATLRSMLEEVDQLTAISDSLILLARLEAGELAVDHTEQDIAHIAEQATAKAQTRDANRSFAFQCAEPEVYGPVDLRLLVIGMGQLLDNVTKHTPAGTQATVTVEPTSDRVTVRIDDSGPGMPEDTLTHLFEHFYRSDAARTRTGSVGLGLTITAAITRAHGGEIFARRSPMGGLQIALHFPKAPETA
jgi:two-component system OmpR family sensor kinase